MLYEVSWAWNLHIFLYEAFSRKKNLYIRVTEIVINSYGGQMLCTYLKKLCFQVSPKKTHFRIEGAGRRLYRVSCIVAWQFFFRKILWKLFGKEFLLIIDKFAQSLITYSQEEAKSAAIYRKKIFSLCVPNSTKKLMFELWWEMYGSATHNLGLKEFSPNGQASSAHSQARVKNKGVFVTILKSTSGNFEIKSIFFSHTCFCFFRDGAVSQTIA